MRRAVGRRRAALLGRSSLAPPLSLSLSLSLSHTHTRSRPRASLSPCLTRAAQRIAHRRVSPPIAAFLRARGTRALCVSQFLSRSLARSPARSRSPSVSLPSRRHSALAGFSAAAAQSFFLAVLTHSAELSSALRVIGAVLSSALVGGVSAVFSERAFFRPLWAHAATLRDISRCLHAQGTTAIDARPRAAEHPRATWERLPAAHADPARSARSPQRSRAAHAALAAHAGRRTAHIAPRHVLVHTATVAAIRTVRRGRAHTGRRAPPTTCECVRARC